MLQDADALRERLAGKPGQPQGRVRAAAATQAFVHLFAPLFESFMRAHQGIEVSFRSTVSTDQTVADIVNGAADVGFASLPVYSPALQVTELFQAEVVLAVGQAHALATRAERFILFERGASIRRATDHFFNQVGVQPALALESNDTYFIKLMVERGMGVSLLPSWAVRDEVAWGWLARLRIQGHRLRRQVAILSLGRFQPSPTRAFLEYVLDRRPDLQSAADAV